MQTPHSLDKANKLESKYVQSSRVFFFPLLAFIFLYFCTFFYFSFRHLFGFSILSIRVTFFHYCSANDIKEHSGQCKAFLSSSADRSPPDDNKLLTVVLHFVDPQKICIQSECIFQTISSPRHTIANEILPLSI